MSLSVSVRFTPALLMHLSSIPAFRPAMPPVELLPLTVPAAEQPMICPPGALRPAMPPTVLSPLTVP